MRTFSSEVVKAKLVGGGGKFQHNILHIEYTTKDDDVRCRWDRVEHSTDKFAGIFSYAVLKQNTKLILYIVHPVYTRHSPDDGQIGLELVGSLGDERPNRK